MSATTTQKWVGAGVAAGLLLVVAAWFLLIGPTRAEAADLSQQTDDAVVSNSALQARIDELQAQFADLPTKEAELAAVRRAMPEDAGTPELIRTLDGFAAETGVVLMELSPGVPAVATPPVDPAAAPVDPAATTDPATGAAVPGAPVTVAIPVTTTVTGDFFKVESFLERLQLRMPRAYLVRGLAMTAEEPAAAAGGKPATVNGDVTLTITGDVFVLRDPAAGDPVATAPGAAAATTAAPAAGAPVDGAPGAAPPAPAPGTAR